MTAFELLFAPGSLGPVELPNRIVRAPLSTWLACPDGSVSEASVRHYARYARGGAGLVMTEYVYVDDLASKGAVCQIGASSDEHVPGLGRLAGAIRAEGARAGLQLVHTGRQSDTAAVPKAPSPIPWEHGSPPEELCRSELAAIVEAFAAAARRGALAGFDVVEIHAAHGYLIQQFLSPHSNRRTDEYGGAAANRRRFAEEVIGATRDALPAHVALTLRVSCSDYRPDGYGVDETLDLCRSAERLGVQALHVSGGDHGTGHMQWSPMAVPPAPHAQATAQIAAAVGIPVIASGSILTPARAEALLADGTAEFVSLARPLLADPDWPRKAAAGREDEIRPCIRCNEGCIVRSAQRLRSISCSVNPLVEYDAPPAAAHSGRVAVVGGGPAGVVAALVLARRGHDVVLYERRSVGGLLNDTAREDLVAYRTYLAGALQRSRVELVLEDAPVGALAGFDAVVLAAGGVRRGLPPGMATTAPARDALQLAAAEVAGRDVAIVGDDDAGVDAALRAVAAGARSVRIIVPAGAPLADRERTERNAWLLALVDAGVAVHAGGALADAATDVVAVALGSEPDRAFARRLQSVCGHRLTVVGDASRPGRIHDAVHGAFLAARSLHAHAGP